MKKQSFKCIVCLVLVLWATSAMAYTLSTGFDGVSISQTDLTPTTGLDQWNDLVRWQIQSTGGNPDYWAQQTPSGRGAEESLLFYGIDASGLGSGTAYSLQFDFINSGDSFNGRVFLGGLDIAQDERISPFAPWPNLSTTNFFNTPLANNTSSWTTMQINGVLPDDYDALYIAFQMGGGDGIRGIDNVEWNVGPAPVPEPSSFILFGAGLGALALWRRKKLQR